MALVPVLFKSYMASDKFLCKIPQGIDTLSPTCCEYHLMDISGSSATLSQTKSIFSSEELLQLCILP